MSFNNIKTKAQGFTIVELLIVVVVIAILAAITIVSYNGITARANTSKAQANAAAAQKKAEAFNADNPVTNPLTAGNGTYPANAATFNGIPSSAVGGLPTGVTLNAPTTATASDVAGSATTYKLAQTANTALSASNGGNTLIYVACAPTADANTADGYFIGYWDFGASKVTWVAGGQYASIPAQGGTPANSNCATSGRAISTK